MSRQNSRMKLADNGHASHTIHICGRLWRCGQPHGPQEPHTPLKGVWLVACGVAAVRRQHPLPQRKTSNCTTVDEPDHRNPRRPDAGNHEGEEDNMDSNKEKDTEMDKFRDWIASRKAAATTIYVETCELGWWYGEVLDPYGVLEAQGELPDDMRQIGKNHFVRSPDSDGWVHERDLSPAQVKAMHPRFEREYRELEVVPF